MIRSPGWRSTSAILTAALDRDRVGARPEAQDGIVRQLDPVRDPARVEHEPAISVVEPGHLERAGGDGLALVGPDGGGVVDTVAVAGYPNAQREVDRRAPEPVAEFLPGGGAPAAPCFPPPPP